VTRWSLIVGDPSDPHVTAVAEHVADVVVFDAATLADHDYLLAGDSLDVGQFSLRPGEHVRGWIRRLAPAAWGHGVPSGSHAAVVHAASLSLLAAVTRLPGVEWLTDVDPLMVSESKLVQSRTAATLGIRMPATVVTNQSEQARSRLGRHVVIKPLGPGQFTQADGTEAVVFAQRVDLDDPAFRDLGDTPFLIQEVIDAVRHFRVVTVGTRVWITELVADGLPLDWRSQPEAHDSFVATKSPPTGLARSAVGIARELRLGYSSQDWAEDQTTRQPVLLDVNPGGQWLFLPEPVATEAARAIGAWLSGGEL
jgi:hypothetical protein